MFCAQLHTRSFCHLTYKRKYTAFLVGDSDERLWISVIVVVFSFLYVVLYLKWKKKERRKDPIYGANENHGHCTFNCHTMSFIANDLRLSKYIQFRPNHVCLQSILNDAGKLKEESTHTKTAPLTLHADRWCSTWHKNTIK